MSFGSTLASLSTRSLSLMLAPLYSPGHRWVCLPDMQPTEGVIFKQYDSTECESKQCIHSACEVNEEYAQPLPPRQSVEVRALVLFPPEASVEA